MYMGESPDARPMATKAELQGLAALHRARERRERGRCLVEGPVLLAEALDAGLVPDLVAAEDGLDDAAATVVARAGRGGARLVRVEARRAARVSPVLK